MVEKKHPIKSQRSKVEIQVTSENPISEMVCQRRVRGLSLGGSLFLAGFVANGSLKLRLARIGFRTKGNTDV